MTAISHEAPASSILPPSSSDNSPQRTSDDLPLPEVPTTATKRLAAQALQQLHRLFFAAKEQVVLFLGETAADRERGSSWQVRRLMRTPP